MNPCPCHHLEAYLAQSLTGPARAEFESHLADCPACRRAVAAEEQLDRLLARAAAGFPPPVPGLVRRVEEGLRRARRRRLRWAVGLAAAVTLASGFVLWRLLPGVPPAPGPTPVAQQPPPPDPPAPDEHALVQVTFEPEDAVLARRLPTDRPHVTIVWVYPTLPPPEPSPAPTRSP